MLPGWDWQDWYNALQKPDWTPGPSFISTVWTILYPVIFITFGIIFYRILKKQIPGKVAWPYILNLLANFSFTPILFGLKNLNLATLDILIVWGTLVWGMALIWKYSKPLALWQVPYLAWVSVAAYLQISITLLNR